VVQIVLTRYLYDKYPGAHEGELTKMRAALANQESLARFARHLNLCEFLLLGKGEMESNGAERESTLSDAFESFMAAVYLDHGLDRAEMFLLDLIQSLSIDAYSLHNSMNPKGELQEMTQSKGCGAPLYEVISITGPDHDPRFEVQVSIQGKIIAAGTANSRKSAERAAAGKALEVIRIKKEEEK